MIYAVIGLVVSIIIAIAIGKFIKAGGASDDETECGVGGE
jgi:hypothetical protein